MGIGYVDSVVVYNRYVSRPPEDNPVEKPEEPKEPRELEEA